MKNYIQTHHTIGIVGLGAAGALVGWYLIGKNRNYAIGLGLIGAAAGWFIANQMGGSMTTPAMTAATSAAPATMPNV